MLQRGLIAAGVIGAKLLVYYEIRSLQACKILSAVVFKIARFTVRALNEQMVYFRGACKQRTE